MWKLLRNLLLATVLVAGALKLLAWYEVGQDAERITAALAPYAQIKYDSVSAGLDGSATFVNLSAAIKRDKAVDTFTAERVVVETPGVFWLLKHSLMNDPSLPPRFGVSAQGLKVPPTPLLDPHWFNPNTLVPFETTGCAAVTLSPADYRRMDVTPGDVREHGEFRYDADAKSMDVTLTMVSNGIATITVDSELRQFDPHMLGSAEAIRKVHVERLGLTYADAGFFKRRNQFCGQRATIGPSQFVEQHVAAVQALLQQHGVEPGAELLKLYRRLVENGGQASILSLPNSTFVAGAWRTSTPEDLLRQLNVTARYGDAPPTMFRLNFPAPPQPAEGLVAEAPAAGSTPPVSPSAPSTATPPVDATQVPVKTIGSATTPPAATTAATQTAAAPPPVASPPIASPPIASATAAAPLVVTPSAPAKTVVSATVTAPPAPSATPPPPTTAKPSTRLSPDLLPEPAKPPVAASATSPTAASPARSSNGLEEFDKAAAKLPPPPKRQPTTPEFQTSEPAPAPGSTLALVWKPTIERLPTAAPERRDYDIIDFAALNAQHGRFVRLITEGGKKVEGYIVSADETDVQLRVRPSGGNTAQLSVPKARIHEIQLLHRSSPPA